MRIVFLGLPMAALLLAQDGHEIALAAVCRKGAPGTRRLRAKLGDARVLVKPALGASFLDRVRRAKPDLIVSWFWTTRIPPALVALAPLGGFGVHPSLLPRWRGPDPYFWAIDAGDRETGVTAHRLAEEYDTGATLGHRAIAIEPRWNAWELARALDRPSLALLRDLVARMARGETVREEPQDERLVTEAPAPDDALLEIAWNRPAARVARRVRAAAPYPGAWTFIGDEAVVLTRVAVTARPRGLEPGEGCLVDGQAVIAAQDGGVALLEGRVVGDDDEERHVDAAALAALLSGAGPGAPVSR
jgi:methionyl-tRNA formyltransferase